MPIKTGPSKGDVSHVDKMMPEYYQLRGWDTKGIPTPEKLKDLSLA
jgi:aldehyde:ferredoxin oxidoreductase